MQKGAADRILWRWNYFTGKQPEADEKKRHRDLLSATPQTIYENVKDGKDRPLLNGNMNPDYIGKMMQERQPYYEKAKDIEIVTDEKAPKDVAFEIIERLQIPMAGKEEEA